MWNSFFVCVSVETLIFSRINVAAFCELYSLSCNIRAKCCLDSRWSFVRPFIIMFSSAVQRILELAVTNHSRMVAISSVSALSCGRPPFSVETLIAVLGIRHNRPGFTCKFLADGALSQRISHNSAQNCFESTCKPKPRVSAAMLERHTRVIVRDSHSSTLNWPLAHRETSGFSLMKIHMPASGPSPSCSPDLWESRTNTSQTHIGLSDESTRG